MENAPGQGHLLARAAPSSYFVLAGFWIGLGVINAFFAIVQEQPQMWGGAALAFVVGFLWIAWIHGFRIEIRAGRLIYRDGLYRSTEIPLRAVRHFRSTWIGWKPFDFGIRFPRLVIAFGAGELLAINTKPFRRPDIQVLIVQLNAAINGAERVTGAEGPRRRS